jgi:hypothetical protein
VEPASLAELGGLLGCARCRGGDLEQAVRHWGLELEASHTPGSHRSNEYFSIEVKRPTFVEAFAKLDRDSGSKESWLGRLFRRQDPEVGDKEFDDQVLITPDAGADEATLRLLGQPALRRTVQALVQLGCEVHLTGNSVWAFDRDGGAIDPISDVNVAKPLTVALAVHVERHAREARR